MPTYDYRCDACAHTFAAEQRITADPLRTCPVCAADQLTRLVSGGGFVLKGGGWYADAYAGGGSARRPAETPAAGCGGCDQPGAGCAKA